MEGDSLELGADLFYGFGVAANISGVHAGSVGLGGVPLSLVTATFGPRYRWHKSHRLSFSGETLLREADGFRSLIPSAFGADTSASSLALQIGGRIDLRFSQHLAVRALEASWLRIQLPTAPTIGKTVFLLRAGIVTRFGR